MTPFSLTAVILTQDEENNIGRCLASLAWVPHLVLVDSGSRDRTVELARQTRSDIRIHVHPFVDFGEQRNWALQATGINTDWVLFLDADEVCTSELAMEIATLLEAAPREVGFYLCYRNWLDGHWLRHCTGFPTWQLRLLKHGCVSFRKEGHGQREVTDGPLGYVQQPYDHYPFSKGLAQWEAKHERYARDEAKRLLDLRRATLTPSRLIAGDPVERRRAAARLFARLPFRPLLRFCYLFLWKRGFLDGAAGLRFCRLNYQYRLRIEQELKSLAKGKTQP